MFLSKAAYYISGYGYCNNTGNGTTVIRSHLAELFDIVLLGIARN
jgi:hypothetical protein